MNSAPLTIWCNAHFPESAMVLLRQRTAGHRLIFPGGLQASNLVAGGADPMLEQANIALGQPDPVQSMKLRGVRWVHLTSAGYTRYDRDDIRQSFRQRGAVMTNSSVVYAEPCAEHIFAMMLALARRLPQCMNDQVGPRSWNTADHRIQCQLLTGQNVLILGLGAIGLRLVELLQPFRMQITAVRRRASAHPACQVIAPDQADAYLPKADHVMNVLPANGETERFLDRRRLGLMKPTAILYNIGRGTTVDQSALLEALKSNKLAGAYLDVTDPEPLPPTDPLWTARNCYITPHTAGGHADEFERLVLHFADNLDKFVAGKELADRII